MADFDSARAMARSEARSLAAFMAAGSESARLWRPEELAAIFRHQMAAPALIDLAGFNPATAQRLKTLAGAQNLLLTSFGDLFLHPSPPIELLELTKDFAKANMDHPESVLPNDVAAALYYISIASALARLDRRISRLGDSDLRKGFAWAKDSSWVDDKTRELLTEALQKIPDAPPHS